MKLIAYLQKKFNLRLIEKKRKTSLCTGLVVPDTNISKRQNQKVHPWIYFLWRHILMSWDIKR